jgi:hypothetical protein
MKPPFKIPFFDAIIIKESEFIKILECNIDLKRENSRIKSIMANLEQQLEKHKRPQD